jgi:hypothetical protein
MLAFVCLVLGLITGWVAGSTITMLEMAKNPEGALNCAKYIQEAGE